MLKNKSSKGQGNWKRFMRTERKEFFPVYRKGKKKDLGTHRSASLTLIPRKVMEQGILEIFPNILWKKEGDSE